ncbi:MAG: hypothetical protein ABJN26_06180 [Stappiaceae bacterium]
MDNDNRTNDPRPYTIHDVAPWLAPQLYKLKAIVEAADAISKHAGWEHLHRDLVRASFELALHLDENVQSNLAGHEIHTDPREPTELVQPLYS